MITIWKRRELLCTFDIQKQAEVRMALWTQELHIRPWHTRTAAEGGRRTGSFGEKAEWGVE